MVLQGHPKQYAVIKAMHIDDQGIATTPNGLEGHLLPMRFISYKFIDGSPVQELGPSINGYYVIDNNQLCSSDFFIKDNGSIGYNETKTDSINFARCLDLLSAP